MGRYLWRVLKVKPSGSATVWTWQERKKRGASQGSCPEQRAGWTVPAEGLVLFPSDQNSTGSPSLGLRNVSRMREGVGLPSPG